MISKIISLLFCLLLFSCSTMKNQKDLFHGELFTKISDEIIDIKSRVNKG